LKEGVDGWILHRALKEKRKKRKSAQSRNATRWERFVYEKIRHRLADAHARETALQQQRFESGSGSALWQGDRARARARSLQTPRLIAPPSAGHPVTSYATC